jgi:alpha-N-arabinofuranosidase
MTDREPTARVVLDVEHDRGPVDPRLFGSFVEHMGRCVYTGIYEPDHPTADAAGFRGDVADLVRELGVTLVRYPGGNFVSGYRWEDGIGPKERRPRRLDLAWRSIEANQVGTDDFLGWAERNRLTPMMAVNLGTRGILEAAELVEYCNVPAGTHLSDRRRHHGRAQPYRVPLWCLGNEMDGPWQTGHMTAGQYGQIAAEAGKAMKLVDPTIELVACGSSGHDMPTFGYWESEVLERAWEVVDYISMHAYYEEHDGDRRSFLGSGAAMDAFIDGVAATVDAVATRKHSRKRVRISFDEWNVWYLTRHQAQGTPEIDEAGPRIEDTYSTLDAVVVGDLLVSLLNHADRVRVACLAQLVNVIAPIRTVPGGTAWPQATFHPFAAVAASAQGHGLVTRISCAQLTTARHGDVPAVAAAATYDSGARRLAGFLTNRAPQPVTVDLRLHGATATAVQARTLVADHEGARDERTARSVGLSHLPAEVDTDGAAIRFTMPAESWVALTARAHV